MKRSRSAEASARRNKLDIFVNTSLTSNALEHRNTELSPEASSTISSDEIITNLFRVNLKQKISMEHIACNDKRRVHCKFSVTNICDKKLQIVLHYETEKGSHSSTPNSIKSPSLAPSEVVSQDTIRFQVNNENLSGKTFGEDPFVNQLFQFVDFIDTIELLAGETKEVIVSFLATHELYSQLHPNSAIGKPSSLISSPMPSSQTDTGSTSPNLLRSKSFPLLQYNCDIVLEGKLSEDETQTIAIPFSASICKSVLEVDSNDLDFGICLANERVVKDFTIWNRSEIPLQFQLTTSLFKELEFYDYESGKTIISKKSIAPFSYMRISVSFLPNRVGDYDVPIYIDNCNDEDNVNIVNLRASSSLEKHEANIAVLDDRGKQVSVVDFGNCYLSRNFTSVQTVTIKNMSLKPVDLAFSSDASEMITFALHSMDTDAANSSNDSVEELSLNPSEERKIDIRFRIEEENEELKKTSFTKLKFRIFIKVGNNRMNNPFANIITCTANVCYSMVEVKPNVVNFGDANIGSVKQESVQIVNLSELPAKILVQFRSKVISCNIHEATIPPKESIYLRLQISPRRVNPNYRKQINITNYYNPANEVVLDVRSNNIDRNMLIFHSLFYDIHTNTQHNFAKTIDFGTAVVNDPTLRVFTIKNTSKKPIKLSLVSSAPKELKLFKESTLLSKNADIYLENVASKKEHFIEKLEKTSSRAKTTSTPRGGSTTSSKSNVASSVEIKQILQTIVTNLEAIAKEMPSLRNEETFVRNKIELRSQIEQAITNEYLKPCYVMRLSPSEERSVFVYYKPSLDSYDYVPGTAKKMNYKIFVTILEYDTSVHRETLNRDIPPREISVLARVCQSVLGITQTHINFGKLLNTDEKSSKISLNNLSDIPLLYRIKKTGFIASGDIRFDDESKPIGVVSPYSFRELTILFKPSLTGAFEETIEIENVQDPNDSKVLTVKALVEKPVKFALKTKELDFGSVQFEKKSEVRRIVITNTTDHNRVYEIRSDFSNLNICDFEFDFELESLSMVAEVEKLEAELDKVEHKLRIAIRKNKVGKIPKIKAKADELRKMLEDEREGNVSSSSRNDSRKRKYKVIENGIRFPVPANMNQTIHLKIKPVASESQTNPPIHSSTEIFEGKLNVYESRNIDTLRSIPVYLRIMFGKPNHEITVPSVIDEGSQSSLQKNAALQESKMLIYPTDVDLGIISVGDEIPCSISVQNTGDFETGYEVIAEDTTAERKPFSFSYSTTKGILKPRQESVIHVYCTPSSTGILKTQVLIQNIHTKKIHTVNLICHCKQAPPILVSHLNEKGELPVCNTYVDKTKPFYNVVVFKIQNKEDKTLVLDLSTNAKNQAVVFLDNKLREPATNVELPPNRSKEFFLALKPYLPPDSIELGTCRLFCAGIQIKTYDEKRQTLLFEKVIPFKTTVGLSVLKCNTKLIDFGSSTKLGESFYGLFMLTNMSMHLPLEYEIIPSSDNISIVSHSHQGRILYGQKEEKKQFSHRISFVFKSNKYGLNKSKIIIVNRANREQQIKLKIRLFVDDESIEADLEKNEDGLSVLSLSNVYVFDDPTYSEPYTVPDLNQTELQALYQQIESSTSFKFFTINNRTEKLVRLSASSDLRALLLPVSSFEAANVDDLGEWFASLLNREQYLIEVKPNEAIKVCFLLRGIPEVTPTQSEALKEKKVVNIKGNLFLSNADSKEENPSVIKVIEIRAKICVSEAMLDTPSVYLKRFGYVTNWEDCRFGFTIRNMSQTKTVLRAQNFDVSEIELSTLENNIIQLESLEKRTILGKIRAAKFKQQTTTLLQRTISIENVNNPLNRLNLPIVAKISHKLWRVSSLQNKQIILPTLNLPLKKMSAPCDKSFSLFSTSEDASTLAKFSIVLEEDIASFLKIDVFNFITSLPLKEHKFLPNSGLDIRVRCTPIPVAPIPEAIQSQITKRKPNEESSLLYFGSLLVEARDQPTEKYEIYGSITQNPSFALSCTKFTFYNLVSDEVIGMSTSQQQSVVIKNLKNEPLSFKIYTQNPNNPYVSVRLSKEEGTITTESSTTITINVEFAKSVSSNFNFEDVTLLVEDIQFKSIREAISLKFTKFNPEELRSSTPPYGGSNEYASPTPATPIHSNIALEMPCPISLKSCTPINELSGRYEIDLGQQELSSDDTVEWYLKIENGPYSRTRYSISVLNEEETYQWLKIANKEGTFSKQFESHSIMLTLYPREVKTYTTYLVVKNLTHTSDVKIVRLQMEVILGERDRNVHSMFRVLVDGVTESNLDLGEVFFDSVAKHRFVDIENTSQFPLEFKVSSNLAQLNSESEVHFSLSLTSLKSFYSLKVEPKQSERFYIFYTPKLNNTKQTHKNKNLLVASSLIEHIDIYIKCRTIKNALQTIKMVARPVLPQMHISTQELVFVADDVKGTKMKMEPHLAIVTVTNVMDESLHYIVKSSFCNFFEVIAPAVGYIPVKSSNTITVKPILSKILKSDIIHEDRFIEEHFTIYNKYNLKEKYWITIKITRDYMKQFYGFFSGPKNSLSFNLLEEAIVNCLKRFNEVCEEQQSSDGTVPDNKKRLQHLRNLMRREELEDVYFDVRYLTDELVFYGLKGKVGDFVFPLAELLYGMLFSNKIFDLQDETSSEENTTPTRPVLQRQLSSSFTNSPLLTLEGNFAQHITDISISYFFRRWFGQLRYFLSYFMDRVKERQILSNYLPTLSKEI